VRTSSRVDGLCGPRRTHAGSNSRIASPSSDWLGAVVRPLTPPAAPWSSRMTREAHGVTVDGAPLAVAPDTATSWPPPAGDYAARRVYR
jgi:hypothetical protein